MGTSNKQLTIVIEEQNMKLRPTVREIKAVVGLTKKSTRVDEGTIFVQKIHILSHKINLRNHLIFYGMLTIVSPALKTRLEL